MFSIRKKLAQTLLQLSEWPRWRKRILMLSIDGVVFALAITSALVLHQGNLSSGNAWLLIFLAPILGIGICHWLGFYHAVIRYMSSGLLYTASMAVICTMLMLTAITALLPGVSLGGAWQVPVIFGFVSWTLLATSRVVARDYLLRASGLRHRRMIGIYGAGAMGAQLSAALQSGREYQVLAFFDDDPALVGSSIQGVKVLSSSRIHEWVSSGRLAEVALAIPSVARTRRKQIIQELADLGIPLTTVPSLPEILTGQTTSLQLKQIDVVELLGRDPVPPNPELLAECISGKTVMVTGAGGSIGSQLCRQIVTLEPKRLVLFEISEPALYHIQQELLAQLKTAGKTIEVLAISGDVTNSNQVDRIFKGLQIQTIYHAAAYKHVPLVEHNVLSGVRNNVLGSRIVAEAAALHGVEHFILISTDKAVRPTNVMGASKRFAEIALKGISDEYPAMRCCMVRFGNVLDSSGSVVPLFREQIRLGGPVTVTHEEVTRYFMTIPEAAELVIQAGSMAKEGEVFVLDMGKPVKVVELARQMIRLSGLEVFDEATGEGDIRIEISGLRPAEKLYEELLLDAAVTGTEHAKIMRAEHRRVNWQGLLPLLEELEGHVDSGDVEACLALLHRVVDGYDRHREVVDHVWAAAVERQPGTVADDKPVASAPAVVRPLKVVPKN